MTEIDWPDSVIEAGVAAGEYNIDMRADVRRVVEEIFTAMATALVKHDREASLRTPTFEGPIVADKERQWHGGVHIWQEPKPEVKHDREHKKSTTSTTMRLDEKDIAEYTRCWREFYRTPKQNQPRRVRL